MADEIDLASDLDEEHRLFSVEKIRRNSAKMVQGKAGECEICGEESPRIIEVVFEKSMTWACTKCRDQFKLG